MRELVPVAKQKGLNLHIIYLIRYILETLPNSIRSIRSAHWNISWTYQIFQKVEAVRSSSKKNKFRLLLQTILPHDFTVKVAINMKTAKVAKMTQIYGENPRPDLAQIGREIGSKLLYTYLIRYMHHSYSCESNLQCGDFWWKFKVSPHPTLV